MLQMRTNYFILKKNIINCHLSSRFLSRVLDHLLSLESRRVMGAPGSFHLYCIASLSTSRHRLLRGRSRAAAAFFFHLSLLAGEQLRDAARPRQRQPPLRRWGG